MMRRPRRSPLFPSTPLSRSGRDFAGLGQLLEPPQVLAHLHVRRLAEHPREPAAELAGRRVVLQHHLDFGDRKSTRLNSSHANISYAVFCLKQNNNWIKTTNY